MSLVETRYAEALVNLGIEKKLIGRFEKELTRVLEIFLQQEELRSLMLNMNVDTRVKKQIFVSIFSGIISKEIENFLMLLLDKNRIGYLPGMVREFNRIADKKQNVLNVGIYSAFPLEESQVDKIKEKYRKLYNANSVKADMKIDKALIGGVKIKIGDRVIDASVAGRVQALREAILRDDTTKR